MGPGEDENTQLKIWLPFIGYVFISYHMAEIFKLNNCKMGTVLLRNTVVLSAEIQMRGCLNDISVRPRFLSGHLLPLFSHSSLHLFLHLKSLSSLTAKFKHLLFTNVVLTFQISFDQSTAICAEAVEQLRPLLWWWSHLSSPQRWAWEQILSSSSWAVCSSP